MTAGAPPPDAGVKSPGRTLFARFRLTQEQKLEAIGWLAAGIMRLWLGTVQFRFIDRAGVMADDPTHPLLWAFWHNRLFALSYMFERYFPGRAGIALTSASKDGALISAIMGRFGLGAIRGSSSRRGAAALVGMKRAMEAGNVIAITPDGPRGPAYCVSPGVVKLAQVTGGTIVPMAVNYSRAWRLPSWDGFMLPVPFSEVEIVFEPVHHVAPTTGEAAFEQERQRFQSVLRRAGTKAES